MLWLSGVCCGRVVYVVARWCMLWSGGTVRKIGVTFWEMPDLFTK